MVAPVPHEGARVLVSACLLGEPVRYDGRGAALADTCLERWRAEGRVVALCPETAGGLPTPRAPAEIEPGGDGAAVLDGTARVMDVTGADVTTAYVEGAQRALALAQTHTCRYALLMDRSPSCGSTVLYSGHHDGRRRAGEGVVAALLRRRGIRVFAPDQIADLDMCLRAD
ncbi:DUF523 domain-containing protein [Roseospira marina]|uniref:DUF523 domain-containing protein n=1 Tax=Roseospira marina TaxID=140057 RepID=A0A5M6IFD9_9PROT|nr:DUF523 domain-containing protein [Roseospira marina]KAA5606991.1 DUF523 domain-containing protein [Roseospira marina]MBB4312827.1 uncharacterized protein YbbK (DUF523 family) [Roseospira marina]MBB5086400.1 uncharacterized protein YbbK (DUF523 family) [Roseospira marina]